MTPRFFPILILLACLAGSNVQAEIEYDPEDIMKPGDWTKLQEENLPQDDFHSLGNVTYRFNGDWKKWPESKRVQIIKAMDEAVWYYNRYGQFEKEIRVLYNASVPTADGNINGQIRFGKSISSRTAMHELAHTMGVGTHHKWRKMMKGGKWEGHYANRALKSYNGAEAIVKGDRQHFWPYGLNQPKEDSETNRIRHVLMVEAICRDMGARVFVKQ